LILTALVSPDEWDETRRLENSSGQMEDTIEVGSIIRVVLSIRGLQTYWSENPRERGAELGLRPLFPGTCGYGFEGTVQGVTYVVGRPLSRKRQAASDSDKSIESVLVDCGAPLQVRNELGSFEQMGIRRGSPIGGVGILAGLVAAHSRTNAAIRAKVDRIVESNPVLGAGVPLVYRRVTFEIPDVEPRK